MSTSTDPRSASQTAAPVRVADPRPLFARATTLGGEVLAAVRPEQLDSPTPCAAFDVRRLEEHLVAVLRRVAAIGRGEPAMGVGIDGLGIADDGIMAAWGDAIREVLMAWSDDAALTRHVSLPWGEMDGAAALASYLAEITIHTWDLAHATGQQPAWDGEVVAVADATLRSKLPLSERGAMFAQVRKRLPPELQQAGPPFADAVPVADGAPAIDRLVAWSGRRP